jgi:NAD(P)-dependent dehydrogenase (short-subunit alcohol dehydrogenase family)
MKNTNDTVVLLTGASSGIGKATAKQLLEAGYVVYATARRVEKMADLKALGAHVLAMDVTDDASMVEGVGRIAQEHGGVDILINNAGYGSYGAIEDVDMAEARRQFEVNVFGLARLTQLVLPYMRENRFGKIINITSMGGKIYTPLGGWYHATKFAVEGLSDCLRFETKPFGIDVVVIEPGGIKTEWGAIAGEHLLKTSGKTAYADLAEKTARMFEGTYENPKVSEPETIADTILKAITARKPRTRYVAGYMARTYLFFRRILPDRMFDRMLSSALK